MNEYEPTGDSAKRDARSGTLSFRYGDENADLSTLRSTDLERVLEGLRELTGIYARAGGFDEGSVVEPELHVFPPREGSFLFDVAWMAPHIQNYLNDQADELTTLGIGGGGSALLLFLKAKLKAARTVATAQHQREDGNWVIEFSDGDTRVLSRAGKEAFNRAPKRSMKALNKVLAPLAHEADFLEVASADGREEARAVKDDYVATIPAAEEDEAPVDYVLQFQTSVRRVEFDGDRNWSIRIPDEGYRNASLRTHYKTPIGPDDTFTLRVQVEHVESASGYKKKYSIIEVLDHVRGDTDDSSHDPQASS